MMDSIVQPGTAPFWIALLTVAGLGLVELVSVLMGASASGLLDEGLDFNGPGDAESGLLGGWMSWLNAGGVPILVLAVILLSAFSAAGFAIQAFIGQFREPLPLYAATTGALALAIPVTRWSSRGLAHIIPRDETSVQEQADFIGLTGTVTLGPLDQGHPGTVRIKDRYDNIHTLRAQAAPGHIIETGALALIVDGANGLFQAIPAPTAFTDEHHSNNGG
ncbi:YqiJ family protein [Shinella curvata]|uniref:YqiJ family protein n=1 Tax=Shinella curvata TaxID=1817964 RepID=A0ABT8XL57_9HYPH|nr:OB-fold-containig protein [Shinella curvata]MCJ8056707.1 YqiJ family protein [Shinella curvata]MDO6124453.1 YqiJ family protein [Shinella curvata]